jgi:hypothetical protein
MRSMGRRYVLALGLVFIAALWGAEVKAATNQATDGGGGGVALTGSGAVTVNSTALQLVKQVWTGGTTTGSCLASTPADAACNGGATTITVAAGTPLKFVIFVKNPTLFALNDVRIADVLDTSATGFTYTATSMKHDLAQADTATSAQIYTSVDTAGVAETDGVEATGVNYASIVAGAGTSNITIGAVAGQVNAALSVPANKTFALEFQATKK